MFYDVDLRHGVQGVECSNHSVPTKKPQEIQSPSGDWIFLWAQERSPHRKIPLLIPLLGKKPRAGSLRRSFRGWCYAFLGRRGL